MSWCYGYGTTTVMVRRVQRCYGKGSYPHETRITTDYQASVPEVVVAPTTDGGGADTRGGGADTRGGGGAHTESPRPSSISLMHDIHNARSIETYNRRGPIIHRIIL